MEGWGGGGVEGGVSGSDDNFPRILRAARRMKPRGVRVCVLSVIFFSQFHVVLRFEHIQYCACSNM